MSIPLITGQICPACRQVEEYIKDNEVHGIEILPGYEGKGAVIARNNLILSVPALVLYSGKILVGNNTIVKYLSKCSVCGAQVNKERYCPTCKACSIA